MTPKLIERGFILAGCVNIFGIAVVTHGLQSDTLALADPSAFSRLGVCMIMLWGLAYIGTARYAGQAILLPLVFAVEKAAYTANWVIWLRANRHGLDDTLQTDVLGGLFLSGYGINDALFGLFFLYVAWRNRRAYRHETAA